MLYKFFDGHGCQDGQDGDPGDNDIANSNNYLSSRLRVDLKPVGTGESTREMKVTMTVDPSNIQTSPIYQQDSTEGYGIVRFCVRFGVYNKDIADVESVEVNFLETLIRLSVRLEDDVNGFIGRVPDVQLVQDLADEGTAVLAYVCDSDSNLLEVVDDGSGVQVVRLCVMPTPEIMEEGVVLKEIEKFSFYRNMSNGESVEPFVLEASLDNLIAFDCQPGADVCAFEFHIENDFFGNESGIIFWSGISYIQFRDEDAISEDHKGTLVPGSRRMEQVEETATGIRTEFKFEMAVMPKGASTMDEALPLFPSNTGTGSASAPHPTGMLAPLLLLNIIMVAMSF